MSNLQNVLVNSLPKSGTHLLEKALMILGGRPRENTRTILERATDEIGMTPPPFLARRSAGIWGGARFYGERNTPRGNNILPIGVFTPYFISEDVLTRWLVKRPLSSFGKAHIPYHPGSAQVLDATETRAVTIIRDPRAVAASMIPYVMNAKNWQHYLQHFYQTLTEDERVDFVIHGGLAAPPGITVRGLNEAFASVLDWQNHNGTLVIRFEDLVGPQGGGSIEAMERCISNLAEHLGVALTDEIILQMDKVFDPRSRTFRGGQIDGWRDRLTKDQIARIEANLDQDIMARAGYSTDVQ